ncbi:MAG: sugar phosphate nucleotidyltransferase [Flavobacteriales bacterium]
MKIVIPMAGMGKRMRPHTLVTPKPLIEFAGKPMVHHIVEELARTFSEPIEEIAFVVGRFGKTAENSLVKVAEKVGAKGSIYYQDEALGTAHAILCAAQSLSGPVIVAFADTLFKADFVLDSSKDGVIWVQKVEDPRPFGVVKLDQQGHITDFVEKPQEFVSDLAIIGIYFFKDGDNLKNELQYLIDNDLKEKGEYQITNALENMKQKGMKFAAGQVKEWLDCGNKDATLSTHARWLQVTPDTATTDGSIELQNAFVIQPCYIGKNVKLRNTIVGPYVSIEEGTEVENSVIRNSIIQKNSKVKNAVLDNSMIGSFVVYQGSEKAISLGDYSTILDE